MRPVKIIRQNRSAAMKSLLLSASIILFVSAQTYAGFRGFAFSVRNFLTTKQTGFSSRAKLVKIRCREAVKKEKQQPREGVKIKEKLLPNAEEFAKRIKNTSGCMADAEQAGFGNPAAGLKAEDGWIYKEKKNITIMKSRK